MMFTCFVDENCRGAFSPLCEGVVTFENRTGSALWMNRGIICRQVMWPTPLQYLTPIFCTVGRDAFSIKHSFSPKSGSGLWSTPAQGRGQKVNVMHFNAHIPPWFKFKLKHAGVDIQWFTVTAKSVEGTLKIRHGVISNMSRVPPLRNERGAEGAGQYFRDKWQTVLSGCSCANSPTPRCVITCPPVASGSERGITDQWSAAKRRQEQSMLLGKTTAFLHKTQHGKILQPFINDKH